jgi:hypothetical protein
MVDDATIVELWKRLLTSTDTEARRLCVLALLCNEDFRLRLVEWFLFDAPGRFNLVPSLYH